MFRRRLYREFPFFLAYTASHVVRFAVLLYAYSEGGSSQALYRHAYIAAEAVDAMLSFAVIFELVAHLFRPYEGLRQLGKLLFRWAAAVLLLVAVVVAASADGGDSERFLAGLFALERSIAIVRGGLIFLLFLFSTYFGLAWRHFAFGIALGFGLLASVELAAVTMRAHLGVSSNTVLWFISAASYNCAVLIWLGYLLLPERQRRAARAPARQELEGWNRALLELLQQ